MRKTMNFYPSVWAWEIKYAIDNKIIINWQNKMERFLQLNEP